MRLLKWSKIWGVRFAFLCGLLGCLFLVACKTTPKEVFDPRAKTEGADFETITIDSEERARRLDPSWLKPSTEPYQLGVGDWLEIEITGVSGSRAETFIMPDGRTYYDLAGGVEAEGLTVRELGKNLEAALKHDYSSPDVNVTLLEVRSRRAWLLGRLNAPGLYPLSQPTTLLEGISQAGGLFSSRMSGSTEELADLGNSFVLRGGKVLPINFFALIKEGDLSQNIYLKDGDYVYLPSSMSQSIHVLGAVLRPQAIGFKDHMNLVSALAKAKGPAPDANLKKVLIIRGSLTQPKVAVVNFEDILTGKATNIELQAFDVVWVPDRPFKLLERYLWVVFDTAATSIAVREGTNAIERISTQAPTVTIPIGQ